MSDHDLSHFGSRAARTLVLLHEQELRAFLPTWRAAFEAGVTPPPCDDRSYVSLDALLRHVLNAARGYLVWTAKWLELSEPEVDETPEVNAIAGAAESTVEHVLERWRRSLACVTDAQLTAGKVYDSNWGEPFTIDSMMEHAVAHPMRHALQLREWTEAMQSR